MRESADQRKKVIFGQRPNRRYRRHSSRDRFGLGNQRNVEIRKE